jgi:hypothetical protein
MFLLSIRRRVLRPAANEIIRLDEENAVQEAMRQKEEEQAYEVLRSKLETSIAASEVTASEVTRLESVRLNNEAQSGTFFNLGLSNLVTSAAAVCASCSDLSS